jgi:nuclear pore complex protein Nup107
MQHKGWYAGSYGQKLGIWRHTQRAIRKKADQGLVVQHLDPDAPTREQARLHAEDEVCLLNLLV